MSIRTGSASALSVAVCRRDRVGCELVVGQHLVLLVFFVFGSLGSSRNVIRTVPAELSRKAQPLVMQKSRRGKNETQ